MIVAAGPSLPKRDGKPTPTPTFHPGDRVIAFAHGLSSKDSANSAFQTYVVVKANATVLLPDRLTFAQGATIPTAVGTAFMSLADVFGLPLSSFFPTTTTTTTTTAAATDLKSKEEKENEKAILIWGASSSGVGTMALQLARKAGFATILATASPHQHARLLSLGATAVADYRSSPAEAVDQLLLAAAAAAGTGTNKKVVVGYAVDAISTPDTLPFVVDLLRRSNVDVTPGEGEREGEGEGESEKKKEEKKMVISHTLPWPETVPKPEGIEARQVHGDDLWVRREDLCEWLYGEALPFWLMATGKGEGEGGGGLVLSPERVVGKGVDAIQAGLDELRKGVSGEKLVVEI